MRFETEQEIFISDEMSELIKRKSKGLSHIEKNNFTEAVKVYQSILSDYPDDIESYLLLGDLFLANEDNLSAEKLYKKALTLDPSNLVIQRRIIIATLEIIQKSTGQIPTDSASVSVMLQGLTGRQAPIIDGEIQKAADLLDKIVHALNPAEMVAKHLDQIDNLLPALIELNIRQARNDRRLDLVNMLQALQDNILQQLEITSSGYGEKNPQMQLNKKSSKTRFSGHIKILVADAKNLSERAKSFVELLIKSDCSFSFLDVSLVNEENNPDLIIACNPHINPIIMDYMAAYAAKRVPIILDLDEDFEKIPVTHPDYELLGLGSLSKSRAYTASLMLANLITVPGETIASHFREAGYKVEVIPFGWSLKNEHWQKPLARRNSINIGLLGIPGQYEDVQKIRRVIIRILREFQQTQLVVCGDPITYKMFENIPENRRLFLPRVPDEDVPYVLGQFDILLVPLNNSPFHLVQTDRLLMQAGVKSIPWIASPMPDFVSWRAGGVTAESQEEWHSYLRQYVQDDELRMTLGAAGKYQSEEREISKMNSQWFEIINAVFLEIR